MTQLSEQSSHLDKSDHEELLRTVARRALSKGEPKLAELIYSKLMQLRPESMSKEILEEVVRSWLANNEPAEAAACLKAWITHAKSRKQEVPEALESQFVSLLFANGHSSEALDLLLPKLAEQSSTGKVSPTLLAQATEAGNFSGRVKELRPYLASSVAGMPLGKASLDEICAAVKAGNHPLLAEQAQWSKSALELAHWFEWSEIPDPANAEQALALYEKLAVLGNRAALDKAADMAIDLQTMGNLLKVMDVVMTGPNPPAMEDTYGHLLGVAGRMDEADTYFQAWLQKHPHDLHALAEYASLCQDRDDMPKALIAWKQAANQVTTNHRFRSGFWQARHHWYQPGSFHPERVTFQKRQAEVHIELEQGQEALAIYQNFEPHQHDNTTLENMAVLAESLGDYVSLNRALDMRFMKLTHPSVNDYLELARSYDLIAKKEQQMKVLALGVEKLPNSLNLRRQYAAALLEAGRPGDAVALLSVASTKQDLRSMCIYIQAAGQSAQYVTAAEFLKDQIGKRRDFPADVRLELGHICHQTGQFDLARGYYSSVPSNAITWPLLAEACFQTGAFAEARKYQQMYLDDIDDPPADQLVFFGDICHMMGDEVAAQKSYDLALESVRNKHKDGVPEPVIPESSTSSAP